MRSSADYRAAARLSQTGMSDAEVARQTGIPRSTIRDWRRAGYVESSSRRTSGCPRCEPIDLPPEYAYVLGLYLGDGHLTECPRGVYRLRIFLDERYPRIVDECRRGVEAMRIGRGLVTGVVASRGCVYVSSYWKHWRCLFPQHGSGPKHKRSIHLLQWQDDVVRRVPELFLRGLIHSDGCRIKNYVGGRAYTRYMFCNHSAEILALFERACADAGMVSTRPSWRTVSVARARDTKRLDGFVGSKS